MQDIGSVGFLGGGNMAEAIFAGLRAAGMPGERIFVGEPRAERCEELRARYGVQAAPDNAALIAHSDTLLLAVKPQVMQAVLGEEREALQSRRPLLLSIAAGLPAARLVEWAGGGLALVRCMPNTPALVGAGVSGLYAPDTVDAEQRARSEAIMRAVGPAYWVDSEAQLDALTAISGSGPAYFFAMIEHLGRAGRELGLDAELAAALARETAYGAAKLLRESGEAPGTLRERVTSPGGTTAEALKAFQAGNFEGLVEDAVRACARRAAELAAQA